MKKQKWYEIEDMDEFVSRIRQIVLDDFFANEDKEQKTDFTELFHENYNNLENKLTIGEAHNIIKSMVESKQTEIGTYQLIISAKNFVKIIDYLNRRIISNSCLGNWVRLRESLWSCDYNLGCDYWTREAIWG